MANSEFVERNFSPIGGGGTSGGTLGGAVSYASAAGSVSGVAPPGMGPTINRILVTLPSGNATWNSWVVPGAVDGQEMEWVNVDATNSLSLATGGGAGGFAFITGGVVLAPGEAIRGVYYTSTILWQID